ncbi:CAP domain-containing protein [Thamnocephalis sphaerospora]|uniref:CAP domain-containing protein n=1 Tax=Thamnocephalis sphaerospora TaxID=78915 RepID=A0A4P9XPH3_9FUNG|nr:CAP domain-containing protein [Thamnocephalis sphaerospora]|eukprot:RKP07888.1 CAP domain-containing protein [Thamnocephalis sphaerospora]
MKSLLRFAAVALAGLAVLTVNVLAYDNNLMLCLVNKERVQRGLRALGHDAALERAAQVHCDDQARMQRMSHDGSDGSSPAQRVTSAGYKWASVAENVAYGYADENVCMEKWMLSPGHRANILKNDVTHFGSAVAYGSNTPYYTQVFASDGQQHNFPVCAGAPSPSPVANVIERQYKIVNGKKVYV